MDWGMMRFFKLKFLVSDDAEKHYEEYSYD